MKDPTLRYRVANDAIKEIQENIDENFSLDMHGNFCLFEIGGKRVKDDRLNFETFMHNI